MTGRDLIIYILANGLENEPVFKNDKFVGFMTAGEAAEKMNVGVATICAWVAQKQLEGTLINDIMYIPADSKSPLEQVTNDDRKE